jgi:hypothetical protein
MEYFVSNASRIVRYQGREYSHFPVQCSFVQGPRAVCTAVTILWWTILDQEVGTGNLPRLLNPPLALGVSLVGGPANPDGENLKSLN